MLYQIALSFPHLGRHIVISMLFRPLFVIRYRDMKSSRLTSSHTQRDEGAMELTYLLTVSATHPSVTRES